ncbi:hypothetical protein IAT38_005790 [Cryptococcus sp. DSM 104549]
MSSSWSLSTYLKQTPKAPVPCEPCSFALRGGYRATTPVLYRHVTLRWPGALDSFFQPSYQEVLRGLDTHGVPIYKYGVWEPKPELMPPSTTRYLVDAFPVGDQATLDVHSGISRTIWACRHVERLVFEDIDILGGELDGRWVSKLVEDLIMQEDLLLYALTVITGVAQRSALCPNLGELVIGQGDIPAGEDW